MPLPTRRTVRPDSRHHRDARRQRISRPGRKRISRNAWGAAAAVCSVGLIVSGLAAMLSAQNHGWVAPVLWASLAGLVVSFAAMLMALWS